MWKSYKLLLFPAKKLHITQYTCTQVTNCYFFMRKVTHCYFFPLKRRIRFTQYKGHRNMSSLSLCTVHELFLNCAFSMGIWTVCESISASDCPLVAALSLTFFQERDCTTRDLWRREKSYNNDDMLPSSLWIAFLFWTSFTL